MKVTVIYAGIGVAGFNTNPPRDDREGVLMSHGVASVVTCAQEMGFDIKFIDLRQLSGWDRLKYILEGDECKVYGISISPVDYAVGMKIIYFISMLKPDAKIIVGGIHPTIFPEMYRCNAVTTIVRGEGEITFAKLLTKLFHKEELPREIIGEKPDLNKLPFVNRELFDYTKELEKFFAEPHTIPSVTMIAGRGCPYHCNYCQPAENAVFGTPYRIRSPENVMAELYKLKIRYNYNGIVFWDDTFTINKKWIMHFADLYERSGINAKIAACSRADIICHNPDMIKRLAEIGVDWLVIGMESGSQRILDLLKKDTTVGQNIMAAEICRRYGINVFATIMFGLPTETNEEVEETIDMIAKIDPNITSPFWYVPIPGTGWYNYCVENNLLINDDKILQTIERTGFFKPRLKNIDYDYIGIRMKQMSINTVKKAMTTMSMKLQEAI